MSAASEVPLLFDCRGERLLGILHRPGRLAGDIGLVLVVGGPQYRVGSHRQFVLLARHLAAAGIPVLRFDYRGMGDSGGQPRDFEDIGEDISAAVEQFCTHAGGVRRIVLWGLCDAATANAFYAVDDDRVIGQIALNPWVRTVEGQAQAYIRHYYLKRVTSGEFWRKVVRLEFDVGPAVRDFARKLRLSRSTGTGGPEVDKRPLPQRLQAAQTAFAGRTLVILSGQDLTAKEYENRVAESAEWRQWLDCCDDVELRRFDEADHTFSRAAWRDQVAAWSTDWILRFDT